MENLIPSLIVLYLIYSFVSALFKRAAQEPPEGEFGEAVETSPYESQSSSETVPSPAPEIDRPVIPTIMASTLEEGWEQQFESGPDLEAQPHSPGITPPGEDDLDASDGSEAPLPQPMTGMRGTQRESLAELLSQTDGLRRGILLAEILGPPKALRPTRPPYFQGRR